MSPNGIRVSSVPDQGDLPSLTTAPIPKRVVLPLQSPWGTANPLVKAGDKVRAGQCLAGSQDERVPPVYASVSGTVQAVKPSLTHTGLYVNSVIVESDGGEDKPSGEKNAGLSEKEMLQRVLTSGILETDAYPLPLSYRIAAPDLAAEVLSAPPESVKKPVETLIVNAMDRQPGEYVRWADLTRNGPDLVESVSILQKVSKARKTVLGVAQGVSMEAEVQDGLQGLGVEIRTIPNKFPLALEPLLVQSVTGKEVPQPSGDARLVGAAVVDVSTALLVLQAVRDGIPPIETVVQVTSPGKGFVQHVQVRNGTLLEELLDHMPRLPEKPSKVIVGGLFLGYALHDMEIPVPQDAGSIVFQGESELTHFSNHCCTNCGFCVRYCPMRLMPNELSKYCEYGKYDEAEKIALFHCIECGICAYVCPARRPMVQLLRFGKQELALTATEG